MTDSLERKKILVIGGGLSGLSTAQALTQQYSSKVEVTVLESRRVAGGRVGSFWDPNSKATLDYCQHVSMGCCVNFTRFLHDCGLEKDWNVSSNLTFVHRSSDAFQIKPWKWLPAPFHQLPLLWQLPFLSSSQRREVQYAMICLARLKLDSVSKEMTAAQWLLVHRQSRKTVDEFWNIFSCSALGDEVEHVSIGSLKQLFIQGFAAHRDAADLWIPKKPLAELFGDKLVMHLRAKGAEVRNGVAVSEIDRQGRGFRVKARNGECFDADHVVSSVPWYEVGKITEGLEDLRYLSEAKSMSTSSITGIHLWFDRPLGEFDHVIGVGMAVQWIFNPVFSKSCSVNQPNHENQQDGFYYQVVISGSQKWSSLGRECLVQQVVDEIREMMPAAEDSRLLQSRIVTDQRAVIVCRPEVEKQRPSARTPLPYFHLAGDWVATGWPSTMEGAVISGRQAATSIAETEGWPIHESIAVQPRGWLSRIILGSP